MLHVFIFKSNFLSYIVGKFVILQPGDEAELLGVDDDVGANIHIPSLSTLDDVKDISHVQVTPSIFPSKKRPASPLDISELQPKSKVTVVPEMTAVDLKVTNNSKLSDTEVRLKDFSFCIHLNIISC